MWRPTEGFACARVLGGSSPVRLHRNVTSEAASRLPPACGGGHGVSMTYVDLQPAPRWMSTAELRASGLTKGDIRRAVASGRLVRLRLGHYAAADSAAECLRAGALHGRLACVSELSRRGIFVRDRTTPHIHLPRTASRTPPAGDAVVHRTRVHRCPHPRSMSVGVWDALLQAVRCQDPRAAIATLDSALHLGVLRTDELDEFFAALPRRYRRLRRLLDARAESGPETFVRLMLRALGCSFEPQARVDGVGRVDFLVDGWLIVECDSHAHHGERAAQRNDRRRDLEAATRGYVVLRLLAEDIMWRPDAVSAALRGVVIRGPRTG